MGRNLSFAVEPDTFGMPKDICFKNSDENLRGMIDKCIRKAIVRELTEEERKQLQRYKQEQKGKKFRGSL